MNVLQFKSLMICRNRTRTIATLTIAYSGLQIIINLLGTLITFLSILFF